MYYFCIKMQTQCFVSGQDWGLKGTKEAILGAGTACRTAWKQDEREVYPGQWGDQSYKWDHLGNLWDVK